MSDLVPGWYKTASLILVVSKMVEDIKASVVKDVEVTDDSDLLQLDEEVFEMRKVGQLNWTRH